MVKKIFMLSITWMSVLFIGATAAYAQEYYVLQHWYQGTVGDAGAPAPGAPVPVAGQAAGKTVHVHVPGNETNVGSFVVTAVPDRSYRIDINEFDTEWYHDATPRTYQAMIHRLSSYGAGPLDATPTLANIQTISAPAFAMSLGGGPSSTFLALRIFLQGLYNPTGGQIPGAQVLAQVRGVPGVLGVPGGALPDIPANATTILDSTTITLNAEGSGTGLLSVLAAPGPHYLLVRHVIGSGAGNHLPVITAARIPITIDGTTTINLSVAGADRQAVWTAGLPDSEFGPQAMFPEPDGALSLKGGDADGNGLIQMADFQTVGDPAINWGRSVPPAAPQADIDGNGSVGMSDAQIIGGSENWGRRASVPNP